MHNARAKDLVLKSAVNTRDDAMMDEAMMVRNPVLGHPVMHNARAKDLVLKSAVNTRDDAMMDEAMIETIDD
jgi:hypothetical protein